MTDTHINMEKSRGRTRHRVWLRAVKVSNIALITLPFALSWFFYYADRIASPYFRRGNWLVILFFIILYSIFCRIYGALHVSTCRISELIYSQGLAAVLTDFFLYLVCVMLSKRFVAVWPFLAVLCVQLALALAWSLFIHKLYFKKNRPLRTIVIWDARQGLNDLIDSYGLDIRFNVIATPHISEVIPHLSTLQGAETVFLCGIHSHDRNTIIKYCVENNIRAYVIPRVGDMIMDSAKPVNLFHLPMLMVERSNPNPEYIFAKRLFDVVVSGVALVVLSPLMAVLALLIRRDGGTAFYRQERLTKDGRVFKLLKFRSMRMDAEKDGVARLSTGKNDDRITPIGRFIRSCRLDELPQLINILRSDMSFVGPRPERPQIAAEYEQELPEFSMRLQVKAGLTGYAQVYGKYNTTPYDKLLLDLRYIAHPSLAEDFKILMGTVKILFLPESTEGVAVGATTAMDYENAADSTENDAETVAK